MLVPKSVLLILELAKEDSRFLISPIPEDGTKPRWLDKYPAAAQVHEHVTRNDIPKLARSQPSSSPSSDTRSNRDSYSISYSRYSEAPSQMMLKGGRSFNAYSTDPNNYAMQESSHHPVTGGIYEENGQAIGGTLVSESMETLSSPQYRLTG